MCLLPLAFSYCGVSGLGFVREKEVYASYEEKDRFADLDFSFLRSS